jgi:hypothetical protein
LKGIRVFVNQFFWIRNMFKSKPSRGCKTYRCACNLREHSLMKGLILVPVIRLNPKNLRWMFCSFLKHELKRDKEPHLIRDVSSIFKYHLRYIDHSDQKSIENYGKLLRSTEKYEEVQKYACSTLVCSHPIAQIPFSTTFNTIRK